MTHRPTRRILGALLALGLSAAGTIGLAPKAEAAGLQILSSHTALSMSANPAPAGMPIVLTAQVNVPTKTFNLGPLSPTGSVTFSKVVYDGDGNATLTTLATASLSGCTILLSNCKATSAPIVLSAVADESNQVTVRATYSGDTLTRSSSAERLWQVAVPQTCAYNETCSANAYAGDGTASANVVVGDNGTNDSSPYPLLAYFDTIPLSCTTAGTGDGLVVDVPGGTGEKQITLTTYGAAATKASANPDRICYSSPIPFTGATFNDGTGQYVGLLPMCGVDSPDACVVPGSVYTPGQTCPDCSNVASLVTTIHAPPGDPKSTR